MGLFKRKRSKRRINEDLSIISKEPSFLPKRKTEEYFEPHFSFKVILLGHSNLGKFDYLEKFGNSWFKANTKLSIGISFGIKEIKIEDINIKLQIWDLASEERWRQMIPYYCRGALGAILMFEISDSETLHKLSRWVQIIRDNTDNVPIILLGSSDDLNDTRQVTKEEGLDFVASEELNGYFECDILTGANLENAFESLTKMIITKYEMK
ncbi:MAG: GTP-binding protein [Candidatus Lokiarchaeota archaeon]|nr:GTP-binding protein [Candidatus Lokiarchaeota archaeon]